MNTLKWKRWIANFFFAPTSSPRKLVLLYHAVGHGAQAMSKEKFTEQMQWLKNNAVVMPLSALLESQSQEKLQVSITFDDGYACLYETVLPILSTFNFSATVYVNTGWIGERLEQRKMSDQTLGHYSDEAFLTWDEIKELRKNKWEIGSHGVDHLDLTKQSNEKIIDELTASKQDIESHLEEECQKFAYTWGRYNQKVRSSVISAGYCSAAAAHHAVLSKKEDVFSFPRVNVDKNYSIYDFKAIMLGRWDYLVFIQKIKKFIGTR